MSYRGHVKNGQIMLNGSVRLPEGASVNVEVVDNTARVSQPANRLKLDRVDPIRMAGGSLADELVRDRR